MDPQGGLPQLLQPTDTPGLVEALVAEVARDVCGAQPTARGIAPQISTPDLDGVPAALSGSIGLFTQAAEDAAWPPSPGQGRSHPGAAWTLPGLQIAECSLQAGTQ